MPIAPLFTSLTLSEVKGVTLTGGGQDVLEGRYPLGHCASILIATGESALAVIDDDGEVVGIFTENDIMRVYSEMISRDLAVEKWLKTGMSRTSPETLKKLIVRPSDSLKTVAERMAMNKFDSDVSCHHVVVQGEGERTCKVVSTLNMVRALYESYALAPPQTTSREEKGHERYTEESLADITKRSAIFNIMKQRENIFTCTPSCTIQKVLRVMQMSGQNCILVVDGDNVSGVVTSHDVARAYLNKVVVSSAIEAIASDATSRSIDYDCSIIDAIGKMASEGFNHLVVVRPGSKNVAGTVSSLDIVLRSAAPALLPQFVGPSVGRFIESPGFWSKTEVCDLDTTLHQAAELLLKSNRTALIVTMLGTELELFTEFDLVRAFVAGWDKSRTLADWFAERDVFFRHLLVKPPVLLTEAASRMSGDIESGLGSRHHLVVEGEGGKWLGVLSDLDIARALSRPDSGLDTANSPDATKVEAIMKRVPATCKPDDTILTALRKIVETGHSCCVIEDKAARGFHGLVTPRVAIEAYAHNISRDSVVVSQLYTDGRCCDGARVIVPEARLVDAAVVMSAESLHHLVVIDSRTGVLEGIVSSLEIVRAVSSMTSHIPFVSLGLLGEARVLSRTI